MPPSAWIAARRIERARVLLKTTDQPLQQIADACGYADLSHFSHRFRAALGAAATAAFSASPRGGYPRLGNDVSISVIRLTISSP
jgi:AraC-like DNA-binding protein